jgi:hypothetical protein
MSSKAEPGALARERYGWSLWQEALMLALRTGFRSGGVWSSPAGIWQEALMLAFEDGLSFWQWGWSSPAGIGVEDLMLAFGRKLSCWN